MAERVVVKNGSTTTEFTYGDYQDWNNPLNKVDALYAGKIVERRNGMAARDLTTVLNRVGLFSRQVGDPDGARGAFEE